MMHDQYVNWLKSELFRLEKDIQDLEFYIAAKRQLTKSRVAKIMDHNKIEANEFIVEECLNFIKTKLKNPDKKESKSYELLAGINHPLRAAK